MEFGAGCKAQHFKSTVQTNKRKKAYNDFFFLAGGHLSPKPCSGTGEMWTFVYDVTWQVASWAAAGFPPYDGTRVSGSTPEPLHHPGGQATASARRRITSPTPSPLSLFRLCFFRLFFFDQHTPCSSPPHPVCWPVCEAEGRSGG